MTIEIRQQLVDSTARVNKGTNSKRGVTIHETANKGEGAGAQAHANLQSKGNVRSASWHFSVDDRTVIQSFRLDQRCWHAGTVEGNNTHIAIEICVNPDSNYEQAVANAVELVRRLRAQGVGDELVQHSRWTGKNCPTQLRAGLAGGWDDFVRAVNGSAPINVTPGVPADSRPRNGDGSLTLLLDGVRGPASIGRWQEVMGTPIDFVISRPKSTLIQKDQVFLNSVVAPEHIRNLTGKDQLVADGIEGAKTVIVRQFWLRNAVAIGHQVNLTGAPLVFDGVLGPKTNLVHQFALNHATARSGQYGHVA